jgi:succinate-semialdehyde dehydrogenase/glutarate-semialdehyde dehydrogenase
MKTKAGRIAREPCGVIGIVSPWNYPLSIPAIQSLAALVAGNSAAVKPSEFTSLVALELASLLYEAGVPKDVFHIVVGDGATGAALVYSGIDKLVFTGSVATGTRIAQAAATRLLPVVLELGGKNPMLVLEDADIEVASSGAVWGAFMNAGQTCLSVERCYVHRKLYEPFFEACTAKVKQFARGQRPVSRHRCRTHDPSAPAANRRATRGRRKVPRCAGVDRRKTNTATGTQFLCAYRGRRRRSQYAHHA